MWKRILNWIKNKLYKNMIQPGMSFGGDGPIMQGTWYNPNTGDSFTVRDSFFEDNQYIVTTTDGRYLRYDQIQNYIQSDMKLEDLKKLKQNQQTKKGEQLPASVSSLIDDSEDPYASMLLPEDADILNKPANLGNINDPFKPVVKTLPYQPVECVQQNMNITIIDKALKNTPQPKFNITLDWDEFPQKQIEMLYDIMEISETEIVDWYLDNIQLSDIIEVIQNSIKERIIGKPTEAVDVESTIDTIEIEEIVKENESPATKSKRSKKSKK